MSTTPARPEAGPPTPADIVGWWLALGAERWFVKDTGIDEAIRGRFGGAYEAAAAGRLDGWEESPEGALALVLLLDQFPRNMFRGDPRAFATDALGTVFDRVIACQSFWYERCSQASTTSFSTATCWLINPFWKCGISPTVSGSGPLWPTRHGISTIASASKL